MLSNEQIVNIRKATRTSDLTAWADTLAFAKAIEQAVLAQLTADNVSTLIPESLRTEGPWKRQEHNGITYLIGQKPLGSDAAIFVHLHSNGNFDTRADELQFSLDLERLLNGLASVPK